MSRTKSDSMGLDIVDAWLRGCLPVPIVVTTNLSLSMESKSLANATLAQRNGP